MIPTRETEMLSFCAAEDGLSYVVAAWLGPERSQRLEVAVQKSMVENAVFNEVPIALEVQLDGSVAAYVNEGSHRTLASSRFATLFEQALDPDALALEDQNADLTGLEIELASALSFVREQSRLSLRDNPDPL